MSDVDRALRPSPSRKTTVSDTTLEPDTFSPECADLLSACAPDQMIRALIRPSGKGRAESLEPRADAVGDAVRGARGRLGTGPELIDRLKSDLETKAEDLMDELPEARPLWLAEALAVTLPAGRLIELGRHRDVRRVELQPTLQAARRAPERISDEDSSRLELELDHQGAGLEPRIALLDTAGTPAGPPHGPSTDRPTVSVGPYDAVGERWLATLQELIPEARWLPIRVFEPQVGCRPEASFAQVVDGLQQALEQQADLVLMDLGAAAFEPIWHLPLLGCTLHGTTVIVSGCPSTDRERGTPIHLPLAGCYANGPLRTDLRVSGAELGHHRLRGSLAAACRTAAAVTWIQRVAPKLRHRPDLVASRLFAGGDGGRVPGSKIFLDMGSTVSAAPPAA